jgi:hypothetical protein
MATPTTLPASFTAGQVLTAAQMNDLRGAFRVLQVVQATNSTAVTSTSTSYVTTGLNATITPSSTTSKVLVLVTVVARNQNATGTGSYTIFRGTVAGTNLFGAPGFAYIYGDPIMRCTVAGNYLDSPATTSAQTYTVGMKTDSATSAVYAQEASTTSTMTLLEISA